MLQVQGWLTGGVGPISSPMFLIYGMNCNGEDGFFQLRRLLSAFLVLSRSSAASTRLWCPCFLGGGKNQRTEVSPFGCPVSTFPGQTLLCNGGVLELLSLSLRVSSPVSHIL